MTATAQCSATRSGRSKVVAIFVTLAMVLAGVVGITGTASAAPGDMRPPFDIGQKWYVCEGYNVGTHTGTSKYGLDLAGGPGCSRNAAAGRNVRAPMSGTIVYYQAAYGNLCINVAGGRSVTLTHINPTITSGSVTAGQKVGTVAAAVAGLQYPRNNNVAHIHFQIWDSSNCYNSAVIPFDSGHGARICGAPDLTASGPSGGNGIWSGASFKGEMCGNEPPPEPEPEPEPNPIVDNGFYVNTGMDSSWGYSFTYGLASDQIVMGDWDCNGTDTPAYYRGNTFYVNTGMDSNWEWSTVFGQPGDTAFAGDWDGDGIDTPAVRRGSTFYVNTGWDSSWEYSAVYGNATDHALVGDWDGEGPESPVVRHEVLP